MRRDLKPANIVFKYDEASVLGPLSALSEREFISAAEAGTVLLKIADFGFARFLPDGELTSTSCGTPVYMAPEVLMKKDKYDAKADEWSLGVVIFECLTGHVPFSMSTKEALKEFYQSTVDLRPKIPPNTSPELTDLLLRLLKCNAWDRIEINDLCAHPFLGVNRPLQSEDPITSVPKASRARQLSFVFSYQDN